jgi:hypothetical protein
VAFGDYEILGTIGSGGRQLLAWRDLPISVRGHYAMCPVEETRVGDPEYQERLLRSAALGGRIDHPTLIRVHEVLFEEQRAAVVTDFVDGVSLEEVVVRREAAGASVAPEAALELAASLLEAAQAIHEMVDDDGRPCFHGRISPAQVMLTVDGGVKLAGFGVAAVLPERRSADRLGPDADQYAIGLILLDLLAGHRIAVDESLHPSHGCWPSKLDAALRGLDIRDPVVPVLLRLLAPESDNRYYDAAEAAWQVRRVRSRLPGSQSLPAFAAAEVERVRADVAEETDQGWADEPETSQPEVELVDDFGCEWLDDDASLDEDLALTINDDEPLVRSTTVPFGQEFVPRAAQWWLQEDGEEETSKTEPGVVLGWEFSSVADIPAIGLPVAPPEAWSTSEDWAAPLSSAAPVLDPETTAPWLPAETTAEWTEPVQPRMEPPLPPREREVAGVGMDSLKTIPFASSPGVDSLKTLPFAQTYSPADVETKSVPAWMLGADTTPIRVQGEGATRVPPRRRSVRGPLSLPGRQVKARRRRRRRSAPGPLVNSGFARRWEKSSWLDRSSVLKSFVLIVAVVVLIAVVESFKRQWVDTPRAEANAAEVSSVPGAPPAPID